MSAAYRCSGCGYVYDDERQGGVAVEDDLQGEVDVAVAAYRDEGGWQLTRLPAGVTGDIEEVEYRARLEVLRSQQPQPPQR